jgi:hypothetical protein
MKNYTVFICLLPLLCSCSRIAEFLFEAETENKKASITATKATEGCYKEIKDLKHVVDTDLEMPHFIQKGKI